MMKISYAPLMEATLEATIGNDGPENIWVSPKTLEALAEWLMENNHPVIFRFQDAMVQHAKGIPDGWAVVTNSKHPNRIQAVSILKKE